MEITEMIETLINLVRRLLWKDEMAFCKIYIEE